MSLLGKKRIKRDEEDEKVRHNHIILLKKLFKKEYNQMFGIKEEEPLIEDNIKIPEEKNLEGYKKENKEIKIIETTINLPIKEKIKSKSYIKGKTELIKDEKSTINIVSTSENKSDKKIEIKKDVFEKNDENKKEKEKEKDKNELNDKNIFNTKVSDNPFKNSSEKDNKDSIKEKNNNEKSNSLFGKINNKDIKDNKEITENKQAPIISLFGNVNDKIENKEKTENKAAVSLFGNINDKNNNKQFLFSNTNSLFSANNNPLFSGDKNISLFSNTTNNNKALFFGNNNNNYLSFGNNIDNNSLFSNNIGNINDKNNTPLFSNNNNISNPFSQIKGESFLKTISNNNNNENNKNNNGSILGIISDNTKKEGEGEGEDEDDERDKPKTIYVGEPLKSKDYSNYSKLYNTHLNNLYLYNKKDKKYISKGNGNFSIEKTKDENSKQHQAVIVFRNQTGNKLVEGFIDKKINKLEINNKDFNYIVSFGIIMMVEEKPELGFIKIPFKNEENANVLKNAFEKAILFLDEK